MAYREIVDLTFMIATSMFTELSLLTATANISSSNLCYALVIRSNRNEYKQSTKCASRCHWEMCDGKLHTLTAKNVAVMTPRTA
jgi:hypothetical protein